MKPPIAPPRLRAKGVFDSTVTRRLPDRPYDDSPLSAWLYAAYAKGIELAPEDEVLDVARGSGVFLAKHARHVRRTRVSTCRGR